MWSVLHKSLIVGEDISRWSFRNQHQQSSDYNHSCVCVIVVSPISIDGALVFAKQLRKAHEPFTYIFQKELGVLYGWHCLSYYYFSCLTAFTLYFASTFPYFSNVNSLGFLFGIWRRTRRLKLFLSTRSRGTQRGLVTKKVPWGPA